MLGRTDFAMLKIIGIKLLHFAKKHVSKLPFLWQMQTVFCNIYRNFLFCNQNSQNYLHPELFCGSIIVRGTVQFYKLHPSLYNHGAKVRT